MNGRLQMCWQLTNPPHLRLWIQTFSLKKLDIFKVDNSAIQWIRSYLENITQYVSISGQQSNMKTVTGGVLQGLVLGPVLFMVYTNELSNVTKNTECKNSQHTKGTNQKQFGNNCPQCGITPAYADDSTHVIRIARDFTISNNWPQIWIW